MGGGYFEPITSIIPERDAISQIRLMNRYIEKRFGKPPAGMWTAERVWEPTLPRVTAAGNIRYTLLDDTHFRYAGINDDALVGYYVTEHAGSALSVFPIDRVLRYAIPFREPDETISRLKAIAQARPGAGVVYGDDGEKFGLWPGTHEWVFEKGWLLRFFQALLENRNWITLMTFSEYLDRFPPTGRVYLPTAAYEEMTEWSLPARAIIRYQRVKQKLSDAGLLQEAQPFVRGGFFNNFLSKYVEANNMQKRMLLVSRKVNAASKERREKAERYLFAAQCNCAYWHGLFGGLYLNYLRHAIYENLCAAQAVVDKGKPSGCEIEDFNADGQDEILVSTPAFHAGIAPALGGSLFHLDLVAHRFCLTNTMSRVFEAYHDEARRNAERTNADGDRPASIHERMTLKEDGLLDILTYDRYPRYSFMDHIFATEPAVDDLLFNRYVESGDFVTGGHETAHGVHDEGRRHDPACPERSGRRRPKKISTQLKKDIYYWRETGRAYRGL